MRSNYYRRFRRLFVKMANKHSALIQAALNEQISTAEYDGNNLEIDEEPIYKALLKLYKEVGVLNIKIVQRSITKQNNERWLWVITEYLKQHLYDKTVLPITETTRKQLMAVIVQGEEEGWGIRKIVSNFKNDELTKYRAALIARTETTRAANIGAMIAAMDLGIVVEKEWISAQDNRTRRIPRDNYDHLHMDGIKVAFNEPFVVPSLKRIETLQYPGDPNASAGNVCNCRCTVGFIPVRDERGKVIPIESTEPSHPIRTNPILILLQTFATLSLLNLIDEEF